MSAKHKRHRPGKGRARIPESGLSVPGVKLAPNPDRKNRGRLVLVDVKSGERVTGRKKKAKAKKAFVPRGVHDEAV